MREPKKTHRLLLSCLVTLAMGCGCLVESAFAKDESGDAKSGRSGQRNFRTFLPKPGEAIDEPSGQVVQLLLDRQDKGDFESYMIQVLFRGKPADRNFRILDDRIVINFYDTGKPSMRLSKIRGGAVEASSLEELFYREPAAKVEGRAQIHVKRMVRLTIFIHEKVGDLKFRDTLDRTLIHFRLPKTP